MRRSVIAFCLLMGLGLGTSSAFCCPAFVNAATVRPQLGETIRANVALVSFPKDGQSGAAVLNPLQIDPINEDGSLALPADGRDAIEEASGPFDRFSFYTAGFGRRAGHAENWPCHPQRKIELEDGTRPGYYGYLVVCREKAPRAGDLAPVIADTSRHVVSTKYYDYVYFPENPSAFEQLFARTGAPSSLKLAAEQSAMDVRLDFKKFVSVNINDGDNESVIEATYAGAIGRTVAVRSFFKLLFFKVQMKQRMLASFFEDSMNMPSVVDIPFNAAERLHPGSGALLTWTQHGSPLSASTTGNVMPVVDSGAILQGPQAWATKGLSQCTGDPCTFRVGGVVGDLNFDIDINVAKDLVSRGFFPSRVDKVADLRKALGWSRSDSLRPDSAGIYTELSGLPEGRHKVDYWMRLRKSGAEASTCPYPVVVHDSDLAAH